MPTNAIDMVRKKFGLLTVLSRDGRHPTRGGALWSCRCDCGNVVTVEGRLLRNGTTSSCSCLRGKSIITHGMSHSPTYSSWMSMKVRCLNPDHHAYENYGGRGIAVCEEWANSFEAFLRDVGERPSLQHQLDRIDNDRGYEPGNCRWASVKTNVRNRRNTLRATVGGVTRPLAEWSELTGMPLTTLARRLTAGWKDEDVVLQPVCRGKHYKYRQAPTRP